MRVKCEGKKLVLRTNGRRQNVHMGGSEMGSPFFGTERSPHPDNQEDRGILFLLIIRGGVSMPETSGEVVQGTLGMLILKTLALEAMQG
jgi:hypothetical protein